MKKEGEKKEFLVRKAKFSDVKQIYDLKLKTEDLGEMIQ
jgi:hypothetical protein